MRTLIPADSLVYLETNDLAAALQPMIEHKSFEAAAKSKPDLFALKGVQIAIAVTGIEMTEEKLSEEQSVGRIQPKFVVVADTHAFNYQAVRFVEEGLDAFVDRMYDEETTLEAAEKLGGKYFTWTAGSKKAHALVIDSVVWFANDESSIERSLAVRRGEAASIATTGKVQSNDQAILASGYVSTDGIAQIANVVGLKFADEAGDKPETKSAIAGVLPPLVRDSVTEITWVSSRTPQAINDVYLISMPPNIAAEARETLEELGTTILESIYDTTAADIAESLSERRLEAEIVDQISGGQNRQTKTGVEHRVMSDFGLIGAIVARLGE